MKSITSRRIFAVLLDALILTILNQIIINGLIKLNIIPTTYEGMTLIQYKSGYLNEIILRTITTILYFVVLPFFQGGASIGKQLFKITICKPDGSKPSLSQLLIRNVESFAVIVSLTSFLINPMFNYMESGLSNIELNDQAIRNLISANSPITFILVSLLALGHFIYVVTVFITIIKSKGFNAFNDKLSKTKVDYIVYED